VALISVAITMPSLQTNPKVVVPFFKSFSDKNSLQEVECIFIGAKYIRLMAILKP
jgi:hypothetical protein